ncbi:MAG: UvrD-helicase domain-containing protein [candidate division KSB1 bacterium]|nr:UvrD-helicase domain-containing protein [candidate division KSB1 bacterium]MDZ7369141.1 UvrD-helicase domain-containing protein [candidate division KSB1 bacterium]MDZ7407096.1 UvrD-helicase domain-containing protein [candidate division KSB1 bacterium]
MPHLNDLNPQQREAVTTTEGPLLILAGAGSGKTRVITYRLAYLLEEKRIPPENLLAVTFTNKAAREMKERLEGLAGKAAAKVTLCTFHSLGVRILRQHADLLGYRRNFVIYDESDQLALVREIIKDEAMDFAGHQPAQLLGRVSAAKNNGHEPAQNPKTQNPEELLFQELYQHYLERTRGFNAIDFDDILILAAKLLAEHPEICAQYQKLYRYLMVDEYQDTNPLQDRLLGLLAGQRRNLCVVGDDDQSIYSWRGANPEIMLHFEQKYPGAAVIKLEQNYRSTPLILDAANAVIKNNRQRKGKNLWTARQGGAKIKVLIGANENEEAEKLFAAINSQRLLDSKRRFSDYAVLVRTNFQMRPLEEAARLANVPYQLIGGDSFYDRAEIRDVIAYLKVMRNPDDELNFKRALHFPKRGIGSQTLLRLHAYCHAHHKSLYRAFHEAEFIADLRPPVVQAMLQFAHLIDEFRRKFRAGKLSEVAEELVKRLDFIRALQETSTDEKIIEKRQNNVREFLGSLKRFEQGSEDPSLAGFLDRLSLVADTDYLNRQADRVIIMTVHAAKGLEFPYVFLYGMNDGQFPSRRACEEGGEEEERRLCYVAMTRAQRELTVSFCEKKTRYKEELALAPSRFLREIPAALFERSPFEAESAEARAHREAVEQEAALAIIQQIKASLAKSAT